MTGALLWLTGTAGYGAIAAAVGLAILAHFFTPRSWSALAWALVLGLLAASFVGQRELTSKIQLKASEDKLAYESNNRVVAEANLKLHTEVETLRQEREARLNELSQRIEKERTDERLKTEKRLAGIAAGTVRVRYVGGKCPEPSQPDMPAPSPAGILGNGAGIELSPAAGLDVQILRQSLTEDQRKIEYLQGYIREMLRPFKPSRPDAGVSESKP